MEKVQKLVFYVEDKNHGSGQIQVFIPESLIPVFTINNSTSELRENLLFSLNNMGDLTNTTIE